MEFWDLMDKYGNLTGKKIIRGQKLQDGEYHLVVHVWIIDNKDRILIQQRQDDREFAPGMWATHGGSAISGENSLQAALREVKEEIGIQLKKDCIEGPVRLVRKNDFTDLYVARQNIDINDIKLQHEEVKDVKWVTKNELNQMIADKQFYRYSDRYFDCLSKYIKILF